MSTVNRNIRIARLLAGIQIRQLAKIIGMHESQLSKIERGQRPLYVHDLVKIAKALDKTPAELIDAPYDKETAA